MIASIVSVAEVFLRSRAARVVLLVTWMAVLTYWSGQSSLPIDQPSVANVLHGFQHKLAHLVSYALLVVLARWTFDGLPWPALLAMVLTSVFGATDEWHQSFVPGRRAAIDDWAFDTATAVLTLYVVSVLRRNQLPIQQLRVSDHLLDREPRT